MSLGPPVAAGVPPESCRGNGPGCNTVRMKTLGNIIWFVLAGFWLALGFAVAGAICFITIIGIPFGVQAFKLAGFALWPFGRTVVRTEEGSEVLQTIFNVLWLILIGWEMFLVSLASAVLLCITIIGIPFAVQAVKIGALGLWPFGRTIVDVDDLDPGWAVA